MLCELKDTHLDWWKQKNCHCHSYLLLALRLQMSDQIKKRLSQVCSYLSNQARKLLKIQLKVKVDNYMMHDLTSRSWRSRSERSNTQKQPDLPAVLAHNLLIRNNTEDACVQPTSSTIPHTNLHIQQRKFRQKRYCRWHINWIKSDANEKQFVTVTVEVKHWWYMKSSKG